MAATKTSTKASAPAKKAETKATESKTGTQIGVVESDVRQKTRKVVVNYLDKHPKYGKYVRKRTVLQVHDEKNESRLGDRVEVAPVRPMSRTKSWALVRIVERSKGRADLAEIGDAAKTA